MKVEQTFIDFALAGLHRPGSRRRIATSARMTAYAYP
jgi:hypothetical protein